ncbi:MAG: hypothetical protein KF878_30800 [Planctomycetes bacterium]|nr:hypothetical protein [Planctomycetota bacterium]
MTPRPDPGARGSSAAMAKKGTGRNQPADESGDETDSQDAVDDEGSQEEESPRASKRGTGKHKAASGRSGALKKSTGRMKAVASPKLSGHELIPVVCSECYEELVYDSGSKSDEVVCPVCEHAAGRPDDATIHHILDKRRTEKRSFMMAFLVWLVGMGGVSSWAVLAQNPAHAADDAMFWGPVGGGYFFLFVVLILAWKHENNRWEVYF